MSQPDLSVDSATATEAGTTDGSIRVIACPTTKQLLLCDHFEEQDLPQWTQDVRNGTIHRDEHDPRHGSAAVFASADPGGFARLVQPVAVPAGARELYIRVHIFAEPELDLVSWVVLWELISPGTAGFKLGLDVWSGDRAGVTIGEPAQSERRGALASFPRGRWLCTEVRATLAPAGAGTLELFVDGVSLAVTPAASPISIPDDAVLRLGPTSAADNIGSAAYLFDDIAVAQQPIGCN